MATPIQCSFLENPRDGEPGGLPSLGSHRVTRLKRLGSSSSRSSARDPGQMEVGSALEISR